MKNLLLRAADGLGLGALLRLRHRARLPILMYHGIVERTLEPFCWHMLDLARFTAQLEWVARRYTVLPLGEALERLAAGSLPPRSLALTFDDGYLNNRTLAYPVLRRLGLPATVFVVTDMLGSAQALWPDRLYLAFARARGRGEAFRAGYARSVNALKALPAPEKDARLADLVRELDPADLDDPGPFRLLTWDDVRALSADGLVGFGGHTTRHEILRHQSDDEVLREVRESHRRVAHETGTTPVAFAYPNGRGVDFDVRAQRAVAAAGVRFALSTTQGLNDATTDPLALQRICVGADLAPQRFRLLVSAGR